MQRLKQILIRLTAVIALTAACGLTSQAQIVKGEKSVGPKLGYISKNQSAVAGLVFQYAFSNHFRIAPELGYIFRHKDMDAFTFDINAHVPFGFTGEKVTFYPLAGLNYSSWSRHYKAEDMMEIKDVSTRTARFGLNLGAGFDLRCSETLKLSLEAKYLLIKGFTTVAVTAGISYVF
ncbi:MAG: porin family protein [Muribaculaceae bacterium]|nr:porin family protein [Muribaculaceae bacterium]